jgi:hypothetical protein
MKTGIESVKSGTMPNVSEGDVSVTKRLGSVSWPKTSKGITAKRYVAIILNKIFLQ